MTHLPLGEADLEATLLPLLRGRVFHVTSRSRLDLIVESESILPNTDGSLGNTYPQSASSLARQRGYVCLFDLRDASDQALRWGLDCFYFLAPRPLGDELAFLLLSSDALDAVLQWDDIKKQVEVGAFHIPEIECWHLGPLPLSALGEIITVSVARKPVDPNGLAFLLALEGRKTR